MHPATGNRDWPRLETAATGALYLLLDPPDDDEHHVDWLRVRDWLSTELDARFLEAFEYPTFEWYARFEATTAAGLVGAELWWCSFPDHLSIVPKSGPGEAFIRDVAAQLRTSQPDLGNLKTMDRKQWRRWMISLGSPEY